MMIYSSGIEGSFIKNIFEYVNGCRKRIALGCSLKFVLDLKPHLSGKFKKKIESLSDIDFLNKNKLCFLEKNRRTSFT